MQSTLVAKKHLNTHQDFNSNNLYSEKMFARLPNHNNWCQSSESLQ